MRLSPPCSRALACALVLAGVVAAPPARAAEYEVFITVETEEDLNELLRDEQISEETYEIVLELLQRGVDLNAADREALYTLPNLTYAEVDAILAYRSEAGRIADPVSLVMAGVLPREKLLAIAPFLIVREADSEGFTGSGRIRAGTRWTAEDDRVPASFLYARMRAGGDLELGLAATVTRNQIGDVVYDPNRDALSATPEATRFAAPKLYAYYDTENYQAAVGSYRIGFGQRLTFDNSRHYTPNGIYPDGDLTYGTDLTRLCKQSAGELEVSPCTGAAGEVFVTPDYRWSESLIGAAAGVKKVELATGHVQAYGFGSHAPRGIYQYEIYDRGRCEDPHDDDNPDCSAPQVFRRAGGDDPLAAESRFSFHGLPAMFNETIGGGNVSYFPARRVHLGVTGYAAAVDWLTDGIDLDFQEFSRRPYGGPFGAAGFDVAWGYRWLDVFFEAAHSFDSMPEAEGGGGGPAAIARATATWSKQEIEASARYYDAGFANPYARPIAAPDEFDGLRARDEVGARLKYTGVHDRRLTVRALADVWSAPSEEFTAVLLRLRASHDVNRELTWGVAAQYQDKDLGRGGRMQCFEVSIEEDERGEPIPCAGQKVQLTARARWAPSRLVSVTGQAQHELLDEARYPDEFRQDISASVSAIVRPADALTARARVRYEFQDISDNMFLEQFVWTYLDLGYRLRERDRLRLRYDLFVRLDERASTLERVPSPEHWLWLEYDARF